MSRFDLILCHSFCLATVLSFRLATFEWLLCHPFDLLVCHPLTSYCITPSTFHSDISCTLTHLCHRYVSVGDYSLWFGVVTKAVNVGSSQPLPPSLPVCVAFFLFSQLYEHDILTGFSCMSFIVPGRVSEMYAKNVPSCTYLVTSGPLL